MQRSAALDKRAKDLEKLRQQLEDRQTQLRTLLSA
jgi:hypothetical protein